MRVLLTMKPALGSLKQLGGLRKAMPVTALLTTLAAAAMAGVPLFNGFLSKEMFFTETLATPVASVASAGYCQPSPR